MLYVDMNVYTLKECYSEFIQKQSIEPSEACVFKDDSSNTELIEITYHDVRYGILQAPLGIPFSTRCCPGYSTISKEYHVRFNHEGKKIIQDICDTDKTMSITDIKEELDRYVGYSAGFYAFMTGYTNEALKRITPLPWTNQSVYRKRYLTMELLTNGSPEPEQ